MRVTGEALKLFKLGVEALIFDVKNEIATCPDHEHFAKELAAHRLTLQAYELQLAQIHRAMTFENRVAKMQVLKK